MSERRRGRGVGRPRYRAQRLSASYMSEMLPLNAPHLTRLVLNAFRHLICRNRSDSCSPVGPLRGAQRLSASYMSELYSRANRSPLFCRAQRLSASYMSELGLLSARLGLPLGAQRLSASYMSERAVQTCLLKLGNVVLNAFRHLICRNLVRNRSWYVRIFKCSTPFGILYVGTGDCSGSSREPSQCSTPFGILYVGTRRRPPE